MNQLKSANLKKYVIFLVLIIMIVFFSIQNPRFATASNALNIARQVSMTGIAAVGMMFVLLIGGIDLSIGSQVAFVNVLCAYFMVKLNLPPLLAILICMALSVIAGLMMGLLVTKFKIPAFIATLGFMNILKGAALSISQGLPISGFSKSFSIIGQGYIGPIPIPVLIMILIFAIGGFVLNKTYVGRYFYAIGGNEEASRLSGIHVDLVKCLIYALSALFTSIAGIITLSRLNSGSPQTGSGFEFEVITAVVLGGVSISGGTGKISGAITGVLIMGVLSNGLLMMNVNEYTQTIIEGIVLVVAVGVDCMQQNGSSKNIVVTEKAKGV